MQKSINELKLKHLRDIVNFTFISTLAFFLHVMVLGFFKSSSFLEWEDFKAKAFTSLIIEFGVWDYLLMPACYSALSKVSY